MKGKIIAVLILAVALIFGAVVYYTQVYHYYEELPASAARVSLTSLDKGVPEDIEISDFQGIDASSSPIRYRACFSTSLSVTDAAARFEPYAGAEPRVAPGWFDCFDAQAIGALIESGQAQVFTGQRNLEFGIDRVVAITTDGRGYVWHEINECGDKAYDGTPLGDDCPERD